MIETAPVGFVILELMVPSSAQLPVPIYGGFAAVLISTWELLFAYVVRTMAAAA